MAWSDEPTQAVPPVGPPRKPPQKPIGAFIAGGIALLVLAAVVIWLISSGDDDPEVVTPPDSRSTTSTTTSTSTTTTTLPPTTTTTTVPPTTAPPTTTPPTIITIPPTQPPTTAPTTTAAPTTTTTTTTTTQPTPPLTVLKNELEASLTPDGQPPPPDEPSRVKLGQPTGANNGRLSVTWEIKPSGDPNVYPVDAAFQDAANLLRTVKASDGVNYSRVFLRGTYPIDTDGDGDFETKRVIFLKILKKDLADINFDTVDPLDLPQIVDNKCAVPGNCADINDNFDPTNPTTTTTSSTTTTTMTDP